MFDIGFSELLVIGIVALIVIGPQKLPRVARTAGHLLGRLQRYVADVKADINREIELEELRKMRDSMQQAAGEMQKAASDMQSAVDSELTRTADELNRAAGGAPPESPPPTAEAPKVEPAKVEPPKADAPKPQQPKQA
jgi:sec-independent protein translocase protein TatB